MVIEIFFYILTRKPFRFFIHSHIYTQSLNTQTTIQRLRPVAAANGKMSSSNQRRPAHHHWFWSRWHRWLLFPPCADRVDPPLSEFHWAPHSRRTPANKHIMKRNDICKPPHFLNEWNEWYWTMLVCEADLDIDGFGQAAPSHPGMNLKQFSLLLLCEARLVFLHLPQLFSVLTQNFLNVSAITHKHTLLSGQAHVFKTDLKWHFSAP